MFFHHVATCVFGCVFPYADMLRKHPEAVFLCNPIRVSSKSRFLATKICSIVLYQFMEMDCTSSFVSVDPMNSTDQPKKEPKREVKPQIRSARAGLIFPVGKVHRSLKQSCGGKRVVAPAAVYCSAVLEYLTAEVMELAGSACKEFKMKTITPRHMQLAIRGDDELSSFIKGQIAGGGVVPHVHQFLESGKKKKKPFGDDSSI